MDGGSEFSAEFEVACQQKQLPLFVLQPQSPNLNAHLERSHSPRYEEFYHGARDSDETAARNRQLRRSEHILRKTERHSSTG